MIIGQKSDGISFSELIEMHYFHSVAKKELQVPGAQGSEEFGTVLLLVCSGKYPYSSLKLGIAVEMIKPPSKNLTS